MDTRIDKFAKGFFWTGYVVFLSASIPHIAAYFRHFDPITPNWYEDKAYWLIAVAIAIVIDVSDVLVSIAVMRAKASGAKFKDTFGFWVFIVFITALSWLINWQYNVVFGTSQFHVVDQYSFFGRFTIGQINPVLGSAFQVLLLVYTAMAHKFSQKPQTADELQKELERLEALETVQNRLKEYRERNRKKSLIQTAKETLIEAKEAVIELKNGSDEELVSSPETEVLDSPNMEVLTELTGELEEEVFLEENGSDEEVDTDPEVEVLNVVPFHQNGSSHFPKSSIKGKIARKKLFTIAEAAKELDCTPRHVRNLRKEEVLTTDDSGLITGASLRSYKAKRKPKSLKEMEG